ncbi:MAG TPA: 3-dehydroquinate synthase, partial [Steroidobacter sp.]|nr:3-dehydroquinate synthase [Steroidobacter sp.]
DMSQRLGWIGAGERERAVRLIERLQLPIAPPRIGAQRALELMGLDKKVLAGRIRLVLLRSIGRADVVADYPPAVLEATLQAYFD